MEEINEENINKLLQSLPEDLNAVERMILVNEGTVQTLLSVLCSTPVKVEVISQLRLEDVIIRWSKLVAEYPGERHVTVCLAESIIPASTNPEGFIDMINARLIGIGQIIKRIGLETSRHIKGFHVDASTFARTYSIEGDCCAIITEVFNRDTISNITNIPTITAVKGHGVYDLIKQVCGDPDGCGQWGVVKVDMRKEESPGVEKSQRIGKFDRN